MSDTYSVKLDGSEVARITGDGIAMGKKAVQMKDRWEAQLVDDPKLLKMIRDGQTIVVFYVSSRENVAVEKISE
jgi:hypothetical protein